MTRVEAWRFDGAVLRRRGRTSITPSVPATFVLGTTKPNDANTGVQTGVTLTRQSGDITVTTAGTTIQNLDLSGFIKVRAANVTIRNCIVRGSGPGTTNTALVDCNHTAAKSVLVEFCELVPAQPSVWLNGLIGHDYTMRRCNAYNVVDGAGIYNSAAPTAAANVVLEGNYIHDLAYISPDANHTDNRTHNDGVQIQGNTGISVVGNTIYANVSETAGNGYPGATPAPAVADPYYPSVTGQALGVTPNVSRVGNLVIDRNWFDYGAQSITIIPGSQGVDSATIQITNNRFGRNQPAINKAGASARRAILIDPGVATISNISGNIYEDTAAAVTTYTTVAG